MAEHTLSVRTYMIALAALIVLTIATVAVSFLPLEGHWHITAGLGIAVVKASIVAVCFMQVAMSPRLSLLCLAVAFFWLGILAALTFCDYATRGEIPWMPGH